jgi:hypothetical protein
MDGSECRNSTTEVNLSLTKKLVQILKSKTKLFEKKDKYELCERGN